MSTPVHKSNRHYSVMEKVVHWGFAGLLGYGLLTGIDRLSQLANPVTMRTELLFAAAFLALLVSRYFLIGRKKNRSETKPVTLIELTSSIVHKSLYLFPALIAVSGFLIAALFSVGISSGPIMAGVIALHEFSIAMTIGVLLTHILGAVWHRLKGDGVWSSMVPFFKESS